MGESSHGLGEGNHGTGEGSHGVGEGNHRMGESSDGVGENSHVMGEGSHVMSEGSHRMGESRGLCACEHMRRNRLKRVAHTKDFVPGLAATVMLTCFTISSSQSIGYG